MPYTKSSHLGKLVETKTLMPSMEHPTQAWMDGKLIKLFSPVM